MKIVKIIVALGISSIFMNAAFAFSGYECTAVDIKVSIDTNADPIKVVITKSHKTIIYDVEYDESNSDDISALFVSKEKGEMWVLAYDSPAPPAQSKLRLGKKSYSLKCTESSPENSNP